MPQASDENRGYSQDHDCRQGDCPPWPDCTCTDSDMQAWGGHRPSCPGGEWLLEHDVTWLTTTTGKGRSDA